MWLLPRGSGIIRTELSFCQQETHELRGVAAASLRVVIDYDHFTSMCIILSVWSQSGLPWSFWVAQNAGEHVLSQVPGLLSLPRANDRSALLVIDDTPCKERAQCGQLRVAGGDRDGVRTLRDAGCSAVTAKGTGVHELEEFDHGEVLVGCQ